MFAVEIIGDPECPIFYRRTLLNTRALKIFVHQFVPGADREDFHDHPRSFVTLLLRGGYDDVSKDGDVDRLSAPCWRYRKATHAHTTRVHPDGALTLVFMGPLRREWGFWRHGKFYTLAAYERIFGRDFRC